MRAVIPRHQNILQLVEFRCAAVTRISPAHSEARTAEICMAVGNKVCQSTLISKELVA